jgi:hypothetical protein
MNVEIILVLQNVVEEMLEKPEGTIKNRQFRDTGNIRHTRHMTKINKTHNTEN